MERSQGRIGGIADKGKVIFIRMNGKHHFLGGETYGLLFGT